MKLAEPRPPAPKASLVKFKAALGRAKRRNQREPEVDYLNITAMLDLMTIILVFVLMTMAQSQQTQQTEDLQLPLSVRTTEPFEEGLAVRITQSQILVGDDTSPVVVFGNRERLGESGLDTRFKRSGSNDLYIVPLAKVLSDYRERDKVIRAAKGLDPSMSEAVIVADKSTPYRVLIEVMFTLGQSEFGRYHLMVVSGKS